jgi:hypothetical protein
MQLFAPLKKIRSFVTKKSTAHAPPPSEKANVEPQIISVTYVRPRPIHPPKDRQRVLVAVTNDSETFKLASHWYLSG